MPVQDDGPPIVILGGGIAGGNAAVTLREEGFGGRVVLISREPGIPFGRPPLVEDLLTLRGGPLRLVCQAAELV